MYYWLSKVDVIIVGALFVPIFVYLYYLTLRLSLFGFVNFRSQSVLEQSLASSSIGSQSVDHWPVDHRFLSTFVFRYFKDVKGKSEIFLVVIKSDRNISQHSCRCVRWISPARLAHTICISIRSRIYKPRILTLQLTVERARASYYVQLQNTT